MSCLPFRLLSFPRDKSRDVTPRLWEGGWFFIFEYSSPFCFLLIEIHYTFSNSYIVLTCYIYYYCIWWGFKTLFSCFFAGFLLFSPKGLVTGCDSSLAWEFLLFKSVLHFAFLHLLSGYYYYGYVVIGVLRPSWFTEIFFWIGLLLSKEVKQLIIIIGCISLPPEGGSVGSG